jgi:hypothetical protein
MNNNVIKIIEDIEKTKKLNFSEIAINKTLTDLDILSIIVYCHKNNIDMIDESYDINYEELPTEFFSDSEVMDYLEHFDLENEDYGDEVLNSFSKIALIESIKNTRVNFSFLDIKQEAMLSLVKFKNDFYDKLSQTYSLQSLEYILSYFIKRDILKYQKKELESNEEKDYIYILYIKIQSELNEGEKLEDILNRVGITNEYYLELQNIFGIKEFSLNYDEVLEEMERVKRKYNIALTTSKINYLEENALIKYLGLEKSDLKEEKVSEENLNNLIKKAIFKISLIFDISILNDLERINYEMEAIDAKLN